MKRIGWLLAVAALVTGCLEDPSPKRARVLVTGEAGKTVRVTVSSDFVATQNEAGQARIVVSSSEQVAATLPFDKTFNIEEAQQIFAEAARIDTDVDNLRMQVYIDGKIRYDDGGPLRSRPFRFLYMFNRPPVSDVTVL